MISYEPFWKTLKEKEISQYSLIYTYNISKPTLHKLRHNLGLSTHTINQICNALDCEVEDVMKHTTDTE